MGTLGGIPLEAGDVLAKKYVLERLIGEGGTGVVILARHLQLQHPVAIKFLRTALSNEELRLRFEREARAIDKISSEHVVVVYDVGTLPDGEPYMVMEHLEGKDLARILKEDGKLPLEEAVDCMLQVCEALGEAHANGIVHRDLKPANLFLTRREDGAPHIKVVDFGISKILDEKLLSKDNGPREVTNAFTVLGSPRYMAPEQLRNSKDVDFRADLWSVGAVLFQLVTGRHAFDADNNVHVSLRVLTSEPELLRTYAPEAPPGLEAIVSKCLTKDRTQRFQSAKELADALHPYASARTRESIERMREAKAAQSVEIAIAPKRVQPPTGEVPELRAPPSTPRGLAPPSSGPAVSSGRLAPPSSGPWSPPAPSSRSRLEDSESIASVRRAYGRAPGRGLKIAIMIGGVVAVLLSFLLLSAVKRAAQSLGVVSTSSSARAAAAAETTAPPVFATATVRRDPIIVPLDAAAASP
jgi:serine/threonine-protein kinase